MDERACRELAERMVRDLAEPIEIGDRFVRVGASVGAVRSERGEPAAHLLSRVDAAMYRAKRAGKGRAQIELVDDPI